VTPFTLEEIMRGTRYHEAGHAVAVYYHGYLITGVSVSDGTFITNYRAKALDGWTDQWRVACITMAGMLADQRAMWGEMSPEPWATFLADAEEAVEAEAEFYGDDVPRDDRSVLLHLFGQMADDPVGDDPAESYRIVVEDSRQLVTDHWTEIEAVARALEQKGTLDGPEVTRIIERARRSDG
jgi:hypothetical protein